MKKYYWAVRPQSYDVKYTRIEHAETAREALRLAFGIRLTPVDRRGAWIAKNLGTRVAVIQSDNKRIALLTSEEGWEPIEPERMRP